MIIIIIIIIIIQEEWLRQEWLWAAGWLATTFVVT
jgi:hypothetical protein